MSTIDKIFADGEVIIKEGDQGNSFFQIKEGSAIVYKNYGQTDQVKLTDLQPGQYFGEMAVIESYPRSSTVVANGEVKAVEIPVEELNNYFTENPDEIINIMKHLGNRVRELTADYDDAKKLLADIKTSGTENESLLALIQKHLGWFKSNKGFDKPSAEALRESSDKVSSNNVESYSKGTVIFKQGETGNCMYFVHGGTVGIYSNYGTDQQNKLTELYPVACFGEMGMIAGEVRSATAVADSDDTYVEIIRAEDLEELFKTCPVKIDMILRHLSYRLRSLTYDYFNTCKEIAEVYGK
jgi:CRP-like cAMP-binding protein